MADRMESPIAVKVEEQSQSVIFTYFHGDIGSMVDAHFTRALSKTHEAKAPAMKSKKRRKLVKLEESNTCQWSTAPSTTYTEAQFQPHLQLSSSKESHSSVPLSPAEDCPSSWPLFPTRQAGGLGLPPVTYSLSHGGLGLTGQQYATSLLNLLHSDRTEMGTSMPSSSKPDLLSSWATPAGFRDPMDPAVAFEPGRAMDKKDLYWY